jgi:signal transduction histidine kinase
MVMSPRLARVADIGAQSVAPALRIARSAAANEMVQDTAIAALLLIAGILGYLGRVEVEIADVARDVAPTGIPIGAIALIVGQTVPLIWRRRAPVLVLAIVTAALLTFFVLSYFPSLASLGLVVAVYTVAAHRERSISVWATVACGALLLSLTVLSQQPLEFEGVLGEFLLLGAAWVLGDGVRERRNTFLLLESRASSLELERDQKAREAVAQERRVIARELHDVVAHNVGVIVAQAGAAGRPSTVGRAPAEVLGTIEGLGRDALAEMRRLTGLLRADSDPPGWPQPGLADIDALVDRMRSAGVPTVLAIEGEPRPLPAGLSLSAFRIVQEALTNVLKHAGRATARVVVRYEATRLVLTVEDDGATSGVRRPGPPAGSGFGHVGMRERATLYGGQLTVGPRPRGGYAMTVDLPIDGA